MIKLADGGFRPAYNMQIVSAPKGQVIVAVDIDTTGSDRGLARPALEQLDAAGTRQPDYLVDGGFTKNEDIERAHESGVRLWCPPTHSKHGTDPYAPRRDDKPGVADWRRHRRDNLSQVTETPTQWPISPPAQPPLASFWTGLTPHSLDEREHTHAYGRYRKPVEDQGGRVVRQPVAFEEHKNMGEAAFAGRSTMAPSYPAARRLLPRRSLRAMGAPIASVLRRR